MSDLRYSEIFRVVVSCDYWSNERPFRLLPTAATAASNGGALVFGDIDGGLAVLSCAGSPVIGQPLALLIDPTDPAFFAVTDLPQQSSGRMLLFCDRSLPSGGPPVDVDCGDLHAAADVPILGSRFEVTRPPGTDLAILDLDGDLVLRDTVGGAGKIIFDLSGHHPGAYLLRDSEKIAPIYVDDAVAAARPFAVIYLCGDSRGGWANRSVTFHSLSTTWRYLFLGLIGGHEGLDVVDRGPLPRHTFEADGVVSLPGGHRATAFASTEASPVKLLDSPIHDFALVVRGGGATERAKVVLSPLPIPVAPFVTGRVDDSPRSDIIVNDRLRLPPSS